MGTCRVGGFGAGCDILVMYRVSQFGALANRFLFFFFLTGSFFLTGTLFFMYRVNGWGVGPGGRCSTSGLGVWVGKGVFMCRVGGRGGLAIFGFGCLHV